jgi:8-oxo-dGTP diphosphatase
MSQITELAGCVIVDDFGKMLLLHRNTDDASQWELPGGKVEPDERPEEAALRELQEELGIKVRVVKRLGSAPFEVGERPYHYTWFQAVIEHGEPTVLEPELFDGLDYFEPRELHQLALSPNMLMLSRALVAGDIEFAA